MGIGKWVLVAGTFGALLAVSQASSAADNEDLVKRGAYLMNGPVACGNCHTPVGPDGPDFSKELSGWLLFDDPFTSYAANITSDKETGVGEWSDEDLARAIRDGLRPDGTLIGPPMPIEFYRHISDDDLAAIIAYLRQVKPVENEVPDSVFPFPLPPSYGPPVSNVKAPSRDDNVAYGKYLVTIAHCMECHSPREADGHLDLSKMGAGGQSFHGPWGVSVSRNITPHPEDEIGGWTDTEIKTAITTGVRNDGTHLLPPMGFGYYANISDADLNAIIAYLRSLPPLPSVN